MAETFEHKLDWFIKMLLFIVWFVYWPFFAPSFIVGCQRCVKLKWLKRNLETGATLEGKCQRNTIYLLKEIQLLNLWFDIVEPTDVHLGEAFDR